MYMGLFTNYVTQILVFLDPHPPLVTLHNAHPKHPPPLLALRNAMNFKTFFVDTIFILFEPFKSENLVGNRNDKGKRVKRKQKKNVIVELRQHI